MIQQQQCPNSKQKQATDERTAKIARWSSLGELAIYRTEKICENLLSTAAGIDEIYPLNGHRLI